MARGKNHSALPTWISCWSLVKSRACNRECERVAVSRYPAGLFGDTPTGIARALCNLAKQRGNVAWCIDLYIHRGSFPLTDVHRIIPLSKPNLHSPDYACGGTHGKLRTLMILILILYSFENKSTCTEIGVAKRWTRNENLRKLNIKSKTLSRFFITDFVLIFDGLRFSEMFYRD